MPGSGVGPRPAAAVGAVAAGGVLGAEARLGLATVWPAAPGGFPWATLLINATGCLLIGVLLVVVVEAGRSHPLTRPFLGVGVLGGYTTFSGYAVDAQRLFATGHPGTALAALGATPVLALLAVTTAAHLTRRFLTRRPVTGRPVTRQPGAASGGVASGGVASGGVASGSAASGSAASGGAPSGGAGSGGAGSRGAPSGGAPSGGAGSGGARSGGAGSGGVGSGGAPCGGAG